MTRSTTATTTPKSASHGVLDVPKTVVDWMAKVRRSNAAFEKASPAKKRVMLAKDVVAAIDARRIRPLEGIYTNEISNDSDEDRARHNDAVERCFPDQPAVMTLYGDDCMVCAKGALFVARLDRLNGIKLGDLPAHDPSDHLREYFSQLQLDLVESAFECAYNLRNLTVYKNSRAGDYSPEAASLSDSAFEELERKALEYCEGARGTEAPEKRLRMIMMNIIANGGTFNPLRKRPPKKRSSKSKKKPVKKRRRAAQVPSRLRATSTTPSSPSSP